jgi:hypothetical protein
MAQSSPVTTSKRVWWGFLVVAPLLAFFQLTKGPWALPLNLVAMALPIYVTHRLLRDEWRSRRLVWPLFVSSVISAVVVAFTDPSQPTAMHIPAWVSSVFGFYFMGAPLLMTGCVLFELHKVNLRS